MPDVALEKLASIEEKIDMLSRRIDIGFKKSSMTISEAAVYLGCSEWSVYELTYQNKLRTFRVGRRVLIPIKELDRFISEGGTDELT